MLHGRRHECMVIDELIDGAREWRSGALVLRGEAGIGKSALLDHAAARATGMRVLRGGGVEAEAALPFAAIHQLLRPVVEKISAIPERQRMALQSAFGVGPESGQDRFLSSLAVLSVLAEVAEEQPLLCLVDDAQWLDGASAEALTFTARRLEAEGIALIFAVRDEEHSAFPATGLPELHLNGLDPAAAQALLAQRVTGDIAPDVRDALLASTAGNPLGLLELPGSLSADQLAGREPLPERLPVGAGVERVFLQRVHRQPPDTQVLLLLAAAEQSGDLQVVLRAARAMGLPAAALDQAESAGLVHVDATTLTFRHPLVRSAVYRGATFIQRQRVQRALADVLDSDVDADRRAWHLAAATVGADESAAAGLHRAAERASSRGGHAAAAAAYARAAELTPLDDVRAQRLTSAAESAWRAGWPERARDLLGQADLLCARPDRQAWGAHLRGQIEFFCGLPDTAYAVLVGGAEPLAADDPVRAARMLADAGQIAWAIGDLSRLAEAGRRLAALADPDGAITMSAQLVMGLWRFLDGDTARAAPLLRAVTGSPAMIDPAEPRTILFAGGAAMFLGDDARALDLMTTAVTRARGAGAVGALPGLLAPLASLQMWTGRFTVATANAAEGLRLATETGQDNPAAHHRSVLAWIAAVQGRTRDCQEAAESALEYAFEHRLGPHAAIAAWALALCDLGGGKPGEAFDRLSALVCPAPGEGHRMVGLFATADLVEVATRTGNVEAAGAALAGLRDWSGPAGAVWTHALVARCEGLLTDGTEAERHFTRALDLHAGGGRPFDTARTQLIFGEWLRRRRRRIDARVHLRAAAEVFERLGATPWTEQARAELRASGETARRREPSTAGHLTPQEVQIVRFVAGGATNREIAAQLFLSPRTVDYHLHKVFTKLDVSSRAELARVAVVD